MSELPPAERKSVLDSPWYWAYLFTAAALAALFLAGPRYAARQAQLERNYQARQRGVQHRVGETPSTPLSDSSRTIIPLWPLFAILSTVLVMTWWGLWRRKSQRVNKLPVSQPPEEIASITRNSGPPHHVSL
jgi:hypothetical protein